MGIITILLAMLYPHEGMDFRLNQSFVFTVLEPRLLRLIFGKFDQVPDSR